MHVNLLPPSFVWRRLIHKRLRQWACAFGFLTIAFIGGNASLFAQWWIDLTESRAMHLAAAPVMVLQKKRSQIAQDSSALAQKIKQLQSITSQDRSASIIGVIAKSIGSTHGPVQLQEMQVAVTTMPVDTPASDKKPVYNSNPARARPSVENKLTVKQYQMTLKGIAIESEAISAFMENLQKSSVFPKVELRSTQERVVSERSIQEFQLECIGNE
jgi:Tfp pilus assembly protein PilN